MNEDQRHRLPAELEHTAERLRAARPQLDGRELDDVKQRVLRSAPRGRGQMMLRTKLATGLLVVGFVGTGGGAVLAVSGGSSSKGSAANSQYCPPSSPGAGKPKDPGKGGNKCGHPDESSAKSRGR